MSSDPEGGSERPRHRLDPDRAAKSAPRREPRSTQPSVIDTRRYQRIIGLVGLTIVVGVAVSFLLSRGQGTFGIPAGQRLSLFSAPLANSNLNGVANLNPPCTLAQHDPRVLNLCLLVKRAPVALALFVTGSSGCEAQVTALQAASRRFRPGQVEFAAVAVSTSHHDAASAVRMHHWTIPVGYDADGAVGAAYGAEVCPIVELAHRGGRIAQRLIGEHWNDVGALTAQIRTLLR